MTALDKWGKMFHLAEVIGFLNEKLEQRLRRVLASSDESGMRGAGLLAEGRRLWDRVQKFISLRLVDDSLDALSTELACYALQLPLRQAKGLAGGRLGQVSLRERAEQAAELLISLLSDEENAELIDRTAALLRAIPQRSPSSQEARLLADAVNLDDFGVTGLIAQAMHLSRQSAGVSQVAEGFEKRRQYGYWDARLKDGFHFPAIRDLARQRLGGAQRVVDLLCAELKEDSPS